MTHRECGNPAGLSNSRPVALGRGGIIAIQIEPEDCLIDAKLTSGNDELVLITKEGMSLRFHEEQLRDQGRNTVGVWGIRPEKNDHVVASAIVNPTAMLLVAGENGIGKRTPFDDYRRQSRGGKGIITMKTTDKNGAILAARQVLAKDDLMLVSNKGQMIRINVGGISEQGRNTQGVRLMTVAPGEKVVSIEYMAESNPDSAAEGGNGSANGSGETVH